MNKLTKSKIKKHLIVLKNKQSKLLIAIDKNHNLIMALDVAISSCQSAQNKLRKELQAVNDALWLMNAMV